MIKRYSGVGDAHREWVNLHRVERLLQALDEGRGSLAYQPVVNVATLETVSYECCLKINQGEQLVSAGWYIAVTERSMGIERVDARVLKLVVQELHENPDVRLSVNISNMSLVNEWWFSYAQRLLSDRSVANRLTIEITESGSLNDLYKMAYIIRDLKALGCCIAVDDFGAGIFNINSMDMVDLGQIDVDVIKIDGSYVTHILDSAKDQSLVDKVLYSSQQHDIKAIAEFVDDADTANFLQSIGIEYMQGAYFAPTTNDIPWKQHRRLDSTIYDFS